MTYIQEEHGYLGPPIIENLDGVIWYKAPIPRRFHKCWVQTRGTLKDFTIVHRCACGATRQPGWRTWIGKNERRKEAKVA